MKPIGLIMAVGFCILVFILGLFVYSTDYSELGIALISIGGTGIVSAVFIILPSLEFIRNKVVSRAYKHLKEHAKRSRTKQTLSLVLTKIEHDKHPAIKVKGIHKYSIKNHSIFTKLKFRLHIYTDIGCKGKRNTGGFEYIEIGQEAFRGESLQQKLFYDYDNTKETFKHPITIGRGDTENFLYQIYGIYQLFDRFVWTIEDLSDSFILEVDNQTGLTGKIIFSFHHHDGAIIKEHIEWNRESTFCKVEFPHVILPYEGFEMIWELTEDNS